MKAHPETNWIALTAKTDDGEFVAYYSVTGLAAVNFPPPRPGIHVTTLRSCPQTVRRWHRMTVAALKRALAGRKPRLLPPLDLSGGTAFQQRVWQGLLQIPQGKTSSYGELAAAIRSPKANRAVGNACGANPVPVLVPCHRVLAAGRKLGGFSSGLKWKRVLLWREGARDLWARETLG
ncbi:MAG TPA: methylated-DNA--[protein]-cysteine S-methyltransferase [Dongiaceae bacterium]|nr:methylated-DNA--[protein]-cysteine S-methyltransferase [Dongiaceae bacterium]